VTDAEPSDGASDEPAARPSTWGPTDSFNSLLPVVAFVALNSLFGLSWAIVGTTVASLYAMWHRYRRGLGIGVFIPIVAVVLVLRAVIGIVTDSEDVYFGTGIALKFLMAVGLVISVLVKRNAVGSMAPYALPLPASTLHHPVYRSTTAGLTLIWAAYLALSGVFDIWLLSESSANGFVIIRFLVSWPLSTATLTGAMLWASRRLNQIPGFPGLLVLLDKQFSDSTTGEAAT
jgi:intracellular septation protein A